MSPNTNDFDSREEFIKALVDSFPPFGPETVAALRLLLQPDPPPRTGRSRRDRR